MYSAREALMQAAGRARRGAAIAYVAAARVVRAVRESNAAVRRSPRCPATAAFNEFRASMRLWAGVAVAASASVSTLCGANLNGGGSAAAASFLTADTCSVTSHGATPNDDDRDDTAAFRAALRACAGGSVQVPAGRYRLDDTVQIGNTSLTPARNRSCDGSFSAHSACPQPPRTTELYLHHGAHLRRLAAHSNSLRPVVSVVQFGCRLYGQGAVVESENPSPRGVVHLGPSSPFIPGAIQFASISGIRITGQYSCDPAALQHPGESSDNCIAKKNFSSTIYTNAAWNTTPATSGYEQCGFGFCACCPQSGGPSAECPEQYHRAVHGDPGPFQKLDCGHCDNATILGNRSWPGHQQK